MKKPLHHIITLVSILLLTPLTTSASNTVITLNVSKDSCQRVTGFGAAAMGDLMCPITDDHLIDMAYGADSPIGLNILRMEVSPNLVGDVVGQYWDPVYD